MASSDNNNNNGSSTNNTYDNYDYDSDDDDDEAPDLILVIPDNNDGGSNTTATIAAAAAAEAAAESITTTNSNSISSSAVAVAADTADTDASNISTSINPTLTPTPAPTPTSTNNEQDNNRKEHNKEKQEQQEQEKQEQKPCPVTILTGFLGSGKTTLINYILKSPDHGKRIAVIENEFGGGSGSRNEKGLSVESLIARDGLNDEDGNNKNNALQDLIELPNGCICCTVKDTLIVTLELLIEKKRNEIDYIIIEASGVADPGPIASIFWLDETLESRLKLDGIICMIDCKHILHQIQDTEEASKQIAYSDRIILNKIDLLDVDDEDSDVDDVNELKSSSKETSIQDIETEIRKIHPIVPILHTSYSKIPTLNWILDADCFGGSSRIEEVELSIDGNSLFCTDVNVNNDDNSDNGHYQNPPPPLPYNIPRLHKNHKHTSSISTVAFEINGSISIKKLNSWLADILWPNQDESDKVLTAMLYQDEKPHDDNKRPSQPQLHDDDVVNNEKTTAAAAAAATKTTQHIFRIKGIVSVVHSIKEEEDYDDDVVVEACDNDTQRLDPRRYIVQGVYDLWDIHPASGKDLNFQPDEKRIGKIIIIGKHLEEQKLKEGFQECFC